MAASRFATAPLRFSQMGARCIFVFGLRVPNLQMTYHLQCFCPRTCRCCFSRRVPWTTTRCVVSWMTQVHSASTFWVLSMVCWLYILTSRRKCSIGLVYGRKPRHASVENVFLGTWGVWGMYFQGSEFLKNTVKSQGLVKIYIQDYDCKMFNARLQKRFWNTRWW